MDGNISRQELLEIIHLIKMKYGYDFSGYAPASLKRRISKFMHEADVSFFDLKYHITNDTPFFSLLLRSVTVNVTSMFRDPVFYKTMRETVLPALGEYPVIRIWHAGCATGEEVFSTAVILKELGLLKRARIYATDLNAANIEKASSGIIPLHYMKEYTHNYLQSGGMREFSDYYTARYDHALISKELRKQIHFSQHDLVTGEAFSEFHLVMCRNVLIYFGKPLQNRVIQLFHDSLAPAGFLALGIKESLLFADARNKFEVVSPSHKIFRRNTE